MEPPFSHSYRVQSLYFDDRHNVVIAVEDHDFLVIDEVIKPAPFRMHLDDDIGNGHDVDGGRHHRTDADREVDFAHAGSIAAAQDRFTDLGALLSREGDRRLSGLLPGAFTTLALALAMFVLALTTFVLALTALVFRILFALTLSFLGLLLLALLLALCLL